MPMPTKNTATIIKPIVVAWKHVSELRKREKPNIASRLHDSIRSQIKMGATEPLFIASEALRDVEFNPETWD
jgi:hypothetical protein